MNKALISTTLLTMILFTFGCSENNEESTKGDEVKKLSFTYETVPMQAPKCDEVKGEKMPFESQFRPDQNGLVFSCEGGKIWEAFTLVDGQKEGLHFGYHENGALRVKVNYSIFGLDGDCIFYYDNGIIQAEGRYVFGKKEGLWNEYTEQGKLDSEQEYYADSIIISTYHPNNKLASKLKYLNGDNPVPHGKSYYYDLNGELSEVREYWKGELERAEMFNVSLAD